MKNLFTERFWCGTEESLATFLAECEYLAAHPPMPSADMLGDSAGSPRLLAKQGDVGVISIQGSLVNTDSWSNAYLGRTGYQEIRAALIAAANDPSVKAIVLYIQSGGGVVSGVSDAADLISTIDTKVKPVYAFSGGMIASAAYWLGVSARSLTIGQATEAGSIGVLMVHQENSKMMSDAGISTNVIRSGPYKALGTSVEPLSDLAKDVYQAQIDKLASIFTAHVADQLGISAAVVDATMGQGRVFIGQDAVDVGLADAVSNFDTFMSNVQGGIALQKSSSQYVANIPKGPKLKTALTVQEIAALAAGAVSAPAASAQPSAEASAAPAAPAAAPTAPENAPAAAAPAQATDVVALLQGQLATAQAQVLDLSVELKTAALDTAASKKSGDTMRPIVRAAVGNLRVALNQSAAGVEALTDDMLMAEHASLSAQFTSKFKAGGVAAVSSTDDSKPVDSGAEILRMNRIQSNRSASK